MFSKFNCPGFRGVGYVLWVLFAVAPMVAGAQIKLTADDYKRAEQMLGNNLGQYVYRNGVNPVWQSNDQFYYAVNVPGGQEFVSVQTSSGSRKTAASLQALGITTPQGGQGNFRRRGGASIPSPDGSKQAFIKDWNLWVKDAASGKETQLTFDGVEDFGYATHNAGWVHSTTPVILWSPDSKKIASFQQDDRAVKDMYLVKTKVGAPELEKWKYPLAGDKEVSKIYRVIIDVDNVKTVRLHVGADAHRSTLCDDIMCDGGFTDNQWSADSKHLAFISSSRFHKDATLRIADAISGEVRDVYNETVKTQYESGQGTANWKYMPASNEFIWYSEQSDWGHLYLHDLQTGKLKNAITSGNFVVTRILHTDEKNRVIFFEGKGKEAGRNPYFAHIYRVDFDGKNLKLLTPEDATHSVSWSPDYQYFVDNYSHTQMPTVSVLRDASGKLITTLEKADIAKLTATGWRAPESIKVKSANGAWDLYGMVYTPANLDKAKKYPVVNYVYPGPQGGSVGNWSFTTNHRDNQALAELGFVVVVIEGSCNPDRSKLFHDDCYGSLGVNTIPDQVAGIKQLAQRYPFMDLSRVGIWGHSGGGSATAAAMFRHADFYTVGIAESGNHDNRNYEDDWAERYIGAEGPVTVSLTAGGSKNKTNYEEDAVAQYASNLKGKLMLIHGNMDDNVPPYHTYLVVDALIKANKDFDLIILPNARHGYGFDSNYIMRRRWDYFVKNLLGAEPPYEYKIGASR